MTELQKSEIQKLLIEYIAGFESQSKAVAKLSDVSEATIINMKAGKWKNISPGKWRIVGRQIGWSPTKAKGSGLVVVETLTNFVSMTAHMNDAMKESHMYGIIAPPGACKSAAAEAFARRNKNAFYIRCADYFNNKSFLTKVLATMGITNSGLAVWEMMEAIVEHVSKLESSVFLIDEVDKLNNRTLYFLITLYNEFRGKAGIVTFATDHYRKRIDKGLRLNKLGFQEINSRYGKRLLEFGSPSDQEVREVCIANGITDEMEINETVNDAAGDLRRVERLEFKFRSKREEAAQKGLKMA